MIRQLHISPISILRLVAEPALILLLLAASAALLVSCDASQDIPDPTPQQETQRAISFCGSSAQSEATTRTASTSPLEDKYTTFEVWGYKKGSDNVMQTVFPGYYVYNTTGTSNWEYTGSNYANLYKQTTKYWDDTAQAYTFFGVAPFVGDSYKSLVVLQNASNETVTSTADATKAVLTYELDGSDDMVNADGTLKTDGGKNLFYSDKVYIGSNDAVKTAMKASDASATADAVTLTFNQPMAKVRIMFTYPENVKANNVAISKLKFNPVTTDAGNTSSKYINTDDKGTNVKATITVTYPFDGTDITLGRTPLTENAYTTISEPYEEKDADGNLPHATTEKRWYYVTPTDTQGAYYLEGIFNAKAKTAVVPAEYMKWEPGHEYTYVFKITETSLSFVQTIDVYTKWQVGYSTDVEW